MRLYDWFISILIILVCLSFMIIVTIMGDIEQIKEKWPLYRCNPLGIVFSSYFGEDPSENFKQCVRNSSSNFVNIALTPITHVLSMMTTVASQQENSINNSRMATNKARGSMFNLGSNLFGIIYSFVVEFTRIGYKVKDSFSKFSGMMSVVVHTLSTSVMTLKSIWYGPPGQTIKFVSGMCFEENTKLKLKDGKIKKISEIRLGDEIIDGSIVYGLLELKNKNKNGEYLSDIYVFDKKGENEEDIIVSGSHLVNIGADDDGYEIYDYVENHPEARKLDTNYDTLRCLITDTHKICVGKYIFGDWEDNVNLPKELKYIEKKIK